MARGPRCGAELTCAINRQGASGPVVFRCHRDRGHRGWHWEPFMGETQEARLCWQDVPDPEGHRVIWSAIQAVLAGDPPGDRTREEAE